jgi:hypothetical protein
MNRELTGSAEYLWIDSVKKLFHLFHDKNTEALL